MPRCIAGDVGRWGAIGRRLRVDAVGWHPGVSRSGARLSWTGIDFVAEVRVGRVRRAWSLMTNERGSAWELSGEGCRLMVVPWLGEGGSPPGSRFPGRNVGTSVAAPAGLAACLGLVVCPHPPRQRESTADQWRVAHGGARRDEQDSKSRNTVPCACPLAARAAGIAG